MANASVISCEIAVESSFGSLDPSTSRPYDTGLVFESMEMLREGLIYWGEPLVDMREGETRSAVYNPVPEPITMRNCADGSYYEHMEGDITLTVKLRSLGPGVVFTDVEDLLPIKLARSGMNFVASPAAAADTLGAQGGATVNFFEAATAASYEIGHMISIPINGSLEHSWITNNDGGDVTCSPAFSRAPVVGDKVHFSDALYIDPSMTIGPSVALRMTTSKGKVTAYGCNAAVIKFFTVNDQMSMEVTLKSAHIEIAHGSYSPVTPKVSTGGAFPALTGSYSVYSGVLTGSAPESSSRAVMPMLRDSVAVTITNTLVGTGYTGGLLSTGGWEVTDAKQSVEFTVRDPLTAFDSMLWALEQRGVFFGMSPCYVGMGMGIAVPGATTAKNLSKRTFADDQEQQAFELMPGLFAGDGLGVGDDSLKNCPLKICFVKN